MVVAPPLSSTTLTVLQPALPAVPIPRASSTSNSGSTGPIRTQKSQAKARPTPTARVSKRVAAGSTIQTSANVPQVEIPQVDVSEVHTPGIDPPQPTALPSNLPQANATPTEIDGPVIATTPTEPDEPTIGATLPDPTPSIISNAFDVEMGNDWSVPPAPTIPTGPSLPGVEVAKTPHTGAAYLVETPPTRLSEDEEVRPGWLTTAVNSFLCVIPYFGSLGKVVDLYLAQEARLGYPVLVCTLSLPFRNSCSDKLSLLALHFRLITGPPKSPRS